MSSRSKICAVLSALALWSMHGGVLSDVAPHVFVATSDTQTGSSDTIDLESPWTAALDVESIGADANVRVFYDRIYVVNPTSATVQVIDPGTHDTLLTFSVGAGTTPHDILLTTPSVAYVSRFDSNSILKVDPTTGTPLGLIDLAALADEDGLPDMSMMARDGGHLLVQVQRVDRLTQLTRRPAFIAVVDLETDQLLDVDPTTAGIQGIALVGTIPQFPMQVEPLARRLFVSAPGQRLDTSGGIEEIDLDRLRSLGFILPEEFSIGDVGGFAMISPDAGYAIGHTDIVESSHLFAFTRTPEPPTELYFTFGITDILIHDLASGQLFVPDPFHHLDSDVGVNVFDAATGARLTNPRIITSDSPRGLVAVRSTTPGEARDLRVAGHDDVAGTLTLTYRPACGASSHNIVFGRLDDVSTYGYSSEVCDIGTTGNYPGFSPGEDSFFFLVVGTDGASRAGSYGGDGSANERPEILNPLCAFVQDLSSSCDR